MPTLYLRYLRERLADVHTCDVCEIQAWWNTHVSYRYHSVQCPPQNGPPGHYSLVNIVPLGHYSPVINVPP